MMAAGPAVPRRAWAGPRRLLAITPFPGGRLARLSSPPRHRMRVRYSESDLQGAGLNANHLSYAEDTMSERGGRRSTAAIRRMKADGIGVVAAEAL